MYEYEEINKILSILQKLVCQNDLDNFMDDLCAYYKADSVKLSHINDIPILLNVAKPAITQERRSP